MTRTPQRLTAAFTDFVLDDPRLDAAATETAHRTLRYRSNPQPNSRTSTATSVFVSGSWISGTVGRALRRCATLLGTVVLIAGCAATPEADPARDAEAKRFEPVTRDSVIYIYRPDRSKLDTTTTLWADGLLIGEALPGTYFRVIVFAGRTLLHASGPDIGRIEVTTQGNDVTYVEARAIEADSPATAFRVVPAEEAQRAIRACCTLLERWRPGQPRVLLW